VQPPLTFPPSARPFVLRVNHQLRESFSTCLPKIVNSASQFSPVVTATGAHNPPRRDVDSDFCCCRGRRDQENFTAPGGQMRKNAEKRNERKFDSHYGHRKKADLPAAAPRKNFLLCEFF
jgi:hypothetical protein